jgi:hypothetical protein
MLTVQDLENEVTRLSREDLSRFRAWFDQYDAQIWDRQFEADANSGKLDELANHAIADFNAGKYYEV